jgi:light-independent protochlorophyllide reductase subunit B
MERHIAKRLGLPCAVISAPVHVQDFPARYAPQMGFEGANVLFDTWVHPLMMGLEEHLLHMFRDDFEFHDDAAPSHLSAAARAATPGSCCTRTGGGRAAVAAPHRSHRQRTGRQHAPAGRPLDPRRREGAEEDPVLRARQGPPQHRSYAGERGLTRITVETLYDAKAHFSR